MILGPIMMLVGMVVILIWLMMTSAVIGYACALPRVDELESKLQLRAIEIARLKRQLALKKGKQRPDFVLIDDPLDSRQAPSTKHQAPSTKNQEQQRQSGT